jgi:hypothetical protein
MPQWVPWHLEEGRNPGVCRAVGPIIERSSKFNSGCGFQPQ